MVSERSPRVVITGVGALTPLGNSFSEIGDALQAGQSGIDWYEAGTFGRLQKHAAASVKEVLNTTENASTLPNEQFEKLSRIEQFMVGPAANALADADINLKVDNSEQKKRIGIIAGIGAEQLKVGNATFLTMAVTFLRRLVNHHLFIKLPKRLASVVLLQLLQQPAHPVDMLLPSGKHGSHRDS